MYSVRGECMCVQCEGCVYSVRGSACVYSVRGECMCVQCERGVHVCTV